jgi:hypothetical protein
MKKQMKTVAALMMATVAVAAPAESNTIRKVEKKEISAVTERKEKGQGINVNHDSGGLDFDFDRMMLYTNPIYSPKKHTVETYRSQQRKAKKRKKH